MDTQAVVKKILLREPIMIPRDGQKPFMMKFAAAPKIEMSAKIGGMGGSTYIGATPVPGGHQGDYQDDDA